MRIRAIALPLLALAWAACGRSYTEEQNHNNGQLRNLQFGDDYESALSLAALDSVQTSITHLASGTFRCTEIPGLQLGSTGSGTTQHCEHVGPSPIVTRLVKVECEPVACDVTSGAPVDGEVLVAVRGRGPGQSRLHATVELDDGSTMEDLIPVRFVEIVGLSVVCDPTRCFGPHAMFVGAEAEWTVRPEWTAGERVIVQLSDTSVDPPGLLERLPPDELGQTISPISERLHLRFRALAPGVATIHFRTGTAHVTRQIRIVPLSDAIRGEVRLSDVAFPISQFQRVPADTDILSPAPLPTTFDGRGTDYLVLTWLLRDGTYALGGAGRLTSSNPDVHPSPVFESADPTDLGEITFAVYAYDSSSGTARITASVGSASLDWPFAFSR